MTHLKARQKLRRRPMIGSSSRTTRCPTAFERSRIASWEEPPALLGQSAVERGDLYLIICCDDGDWMMGRIAKHKPNAKSFNMMWPGPRRRGSASKD